MEAGEIGIDEYALAAQDEDRVGDALDGDCGVGLGHDTSARLAQDAIEHLQHDFLLRLGQVI